MSEDEIRSQISAKEDEITKVEEEAANKEASVEKEVDAEYDPKIADAESKLSTEQGLLEEAEQKFAEWKDTLKEKKGLVKSLSKEVKTLAKEKAKEVKNKKKEIQGELKTKVKDLQKQKKQLEKELSALQSAAAE